MPTKKGIKRNDSVMLFLQDRMPQAPSLLHTVFDELRKTDVNAQPITLDSTCEENIEQLQQLLWMIGEGTFRGMLAIALPEPFVGLLTLLTQPIDSAIISLANVNQCLEGFLEYPEHNGVALADRYSRRGGTSLVLTEGLVEPDSLKEKKFRFDIVAASQVTEDVFHMYLACPRYAFVPRTRHILDKYMDPGPLQKYGAYSVNPLEHCSDLLYAEFDSEEIAVRTLLTIESAMAGRTTIIATTGKPTVIPRLWQLLIGALRLARCMATWILEGEPFECSVLLRLTHAPFGLIDLFRFEPPIPFDFLNESAIREAAESAQSDELFLVVDAADNHLKSVAVSWQKADVSRHARFSELAIDGRLLLHVREGFVEVYAKRDLALWHDGFRWIVKPFGLLRQQLEYHFGSEHPAAALSLLHAISLLMDRQQGSTIVLVDPCDESQFNSRAKTSLRRNVIGHGSNEDIGKVGSGALASILRMDGAHAVSKSACLTYLARQIHVPDSYEAPGGSGTGTVAAQYLSQQLSESTVVRVSSGGRIKMFKKGEPLGRDANSLR